VTGAVSPARRLAWAARAERLRAEAHAQRAPENDDDGVVRFQITSYYTFEDPARLWPSEAVDRGETTVKPYRQVRVTKER